MGDNKSQKEKKTQINFILSLEKFVS